MTTLNSLLTQQRVFNLEAIDNKIIIHLVVLDVIQIEEVYTFTISTAHTNVVNHHSLDLIKVINTFKFSKNLKLNKIAHFYDRKMAAKFILSFFPSIKIEDRLSEIYSEFE